MKRINIKCPYCGSQALLRPASLVHKHAAPGEEVYVCARFPTCDAYVSAHRDSHLPMGTLADRPLRQKRRQAHIALNRLWEQGRRAKPILAASRRTAVSRSSACAAVSPAPAGAQHRRCSYEQTGSTD